MTRQEAIGKVVEALILADNVAVSHNKVWYKVDCKTGTVTVEPSVYDGLAIRLSDGNNDYVLTQDWYPGRERVDIPQLMLWIFWRRLPRVMDNIVPFSFEEQGDIQLYLWVFGGFEREKGEY